MSSKKKNTKISQTLQVGSNDFKWLIMAVLLIVAYILGSTLIKPQKEANNDSYDVEFVSTEEESHVETVDFIENDDNTAYSYITNPSALAGTKIGAERIQVIPDEINRVLWERNIKGERLEIKNVAEKGTLLEFTVIVLESDEALEVTYNSRLGTISIE